MTNRYGSNRNTSRCAIRAVLVLFFASSTAALGQDAIGWEFARGFETLGLVRPHNCRFRQLRFSPDGKYILARDSSGVSVLAREPFRLLFHQSAENVGDAGFTPDSQKLWFVSRPPHVVTPRIAFAGSSAYLERWSIADAARVDRIETRLRTCEDSGLSPDSRVLACVDSRGTLRVIDIDSAGIMLEKRNFGRAVELTFSPDSRYLAAAPNYADGPVLAWDLRSKAEVKVTGRLRRRALGDHIVFVDAAQMVISSIHLGSTKLNATRVAFPSGNVLSKSELPSGKLFRAADPAFVLIRPFEWSAPDSGARRKSYAVEFLTGQVISSDTEALDVFGNNFVIELPDGKLGLCQRDLGGVQATVAIDQP